MPTECNRDSLEFGTVERRNVVGAFDGGTITSDAGALLLGQTDQAIRLVSRLANCFQDGRNPAFVVHQLPAMLRQRICCRRKHAANAILVGSRRLEKCRP